MRNTKRELIEAELFNAVKGRNPLDAGGAFVTFLARYMIELGIPEIEQEAGIDAICEDAKEQNRLINAGGYQ